MENKTPPLISVCIPVYGVQDFIEKCAESLFSAKKSELCEFIFVDDCTPDNSIEILKSVCEKHPDMNVTILRHEKNRGLAAARNTAVSSASGTYIAHVDSDDSIKENFFERFLEATEENDADLVIAEAFPFIRDLIVEKYVRDEDLKKIISEAKENKTGFTAQGKNSEMVRLLLLHQIPTTIWCKFAKRSLYRENKINWKEGINVGEDIITSIKLLSKSEKTVLINDNLYNYTEFIGFVRKQKKEITLQQKRLEFLEIRDFAERNGFFPKIQDIINLRNAEIRYEYLKLKNPLSLKKYSFLREQKMKCIYEERKDFQKKSTKLLIDFIDSGNYLCANILYSLHRLISVFKGK